MLRPVQLAYGTRGNAEIAVHAVRNFAQCAFDTCKVLVKLDFCNAFNTLHRQKLIEMCESAVPEDSAFFRQMYAADSVFLFGERVVVSERRAQQGDPVGPIGFAVGIHPLVSALFSEVNVWYLYNGTLGGDPAIVLQDVRTVMAAREEYGLSLNIRKCEVYVFGGTTEDIAEAAAAKRSAPQYAKSRRSRTCFDESTVD